MKTANSFWMGKEIIDHPFKGTVYFYQASYYLNGTEKILTTCGNFCKKEDTALIDLLMQEEFKEVIKHKKGIYSSINRILRNE